MTDHRMLHAGLALIAMLTAAGCTTAPAGPAQTAIPTQAGSATTPPTDCRAFVSYDRNTEMPGYLAPAANGGSTCLPFLQTANHPPADYQGKDFYVDEFTDAKLRARWNECKADPTCAARITAQMQRWLPPNKERAARATGTVDPFGKIDPEASDIDLATIRRPAYFSKAPYLEGVAAAEPQTYTVEFTVPADTSERLNMNREAPIKLRGWYIAGKGVDDGKGGKVRALAIMAAGGANQLTAIQAPDAPSYTLDAKTGKATGVRYPNATTEIGGMRYWRENLDALRLAGFDVLQYDRRGEGISGGFTDTNTLEQGEDVLRVIDQLRTGHGLRVLTPGAKNLKGGPAANVLLAGANARKMPIVLGGYSRGSMSTAWAMTRNFSEACQYDLPQPTCSPAKGLKNIKGAILISSFASGAGYVGEARDLQDRNLFLAAMAQEHNIMFYPNSATLASMDKWPAAFFGKGLWDRAESVEGTLAAYNRINGLKDLVLVRGPHSIEPWPREEQLRLQSRMVAFARAVVLDQSQLPGAAHVTDLKALVLSTPDIWEASSAPK